MRLSGLVEIFDASRQQLRIEFAGSGYPVTFVFSGPGSAQSVQIPGITFNRVPR